jgi:hypothetical protein
VTGAGVGWRALLAPLLALVLAGTAGGAPPAPAARPAPSRPAAARATRWAPVPGQPWQWILDAPLTRAQARLDLPVFDIDGFENSAATVRLLHSEGRHVICYIDVGTWENFRPDAHKFPKSLLGRPDGWPGERWLDIRRLSVLAPLLTARFRMCRRKGFDAVEPDNLDGYQNDTGFPITFREQLRFDEWVARTVHALGMSVALKNDVDQARQLVGYFDFALDEQCYQYSECAALRPFTARGKAVLEVEYHEPPSVFCPVTGGRYGFASMRKHLGLGSWREACPD